MTRKLMLVVALAVSVSMILTACGDSPRHQQQKTQQQQR